MSILVIRVLRTFTNKVIRVEEASLKLMSFAAWETLTPEFTFTKRNIKRNVS